MRAPAKKIIRAGDHSNRPNHKTLLMRNYMGAMAHVWDVYSVSNRPAEDDNLFE